MTTASSLTEPGRVDEPRQAEEYADVLSRVAAERRPVIVRRDGADLAAVVPLEQFELFQELLARQNAEELAAQIDWERLAQTNRLPKEWLEGDEPKPF